MTYRELLSALYMQFEPMCAIWEDERQRGCGLGVFVFLPSGYSSAARFEEISYEFWTTEKMRDYLAARGNSDDEYLEIVETLTYGEEFLALIVEDNAVHLHRVTKFGLN